ncbi:hypothetical protein G5I_07251 [Acromyrmex echinatior]|uniref:Uncharacterized protein n=1 Tax=Acromyrmex echinatior TaxID=103372 RepID=F4WNA1_ACREC|nr:hypothetical protein G5I_07251 [Acromyrmex echinatior]
MAEARDRVMGFAGSDAGANRAESRAPRNRIHASPKPANTICSYRLPPTLSFGGRLKAECHPPEIRQAKQRNFNVGKTNKQLLEQNSRQPPGQLKQRLALVRLAFQQLGTICCDDRHYLLTVYLFTQQNLLFRLPDFAALSRLPSIRIQICLHFDLLLILIKGLPIVPPNTQIVKFKVIEIQKFYLYGANKEMRIPDSVVVCAECIERSPKTTIDIDKKKSNIL